MVDNMEIEIVNVNILDSEEIDGNLPVDRERLEKYACIVLSESGIANGEYNIIFIGDEYMTELNRIYKNREGTTDVLSFNLGFGYPENVNGEVYVSLDQAREHALEQRVPLEEESVRLVTHGLLHLAGKVHDTEEEYIAMIKMTERLMKSFFSSGSKK
jgi:probable rRNA maturation factor